MDSVLYVAIMFILWFVNLFNGTGLGQAYHTTDIARIVVYALMFITVILKYWRDRQTGVDSKDFCLFATMTLFFTVDSFIHGFGLMGPEYLWAFCLTYLIGKMPVKETPLKIVGIGYATFGLIVLYIYNFGSALSGWNPNLIAMIGLHSFLIFMIPFYHLSEMRGKIIIAIVAAVNIWLISATDSRSSMVFIAIGTLFALSILPHRVITKSNKTIIFWLLVPLFVAIITVLISKGSYMEALDEWSKGQFKKPFFNGRDKLWETGFNMLLDHPLFGNGNLSLANWHNSIVACFTAYGVPGLVLWIGSFYRLLCKGLNSIGDESKKDSIVIGCIVSVIILYVQQSVELGFISPSPNILPYLIIGIMFGRTKYLTAKVTEENDDFNLKLRNIAMLRGERIEL